MKFVVVTYGTEGDTRPLAVLCRALMNAGHDAHLLADSGTLGAAGALGVPHTALAGDIRAALGSGEGLAKLVGGGSQFRDAAKAMAGIVNTHCEAWMRSTVAAGEGCEAVILSALASFVGLSVAEYFGVAAIGVGMIPITPTATFPSPFLRPNLVPRGLNRASHRFVNFMLWRAFRKATNEARASVCRLPARQKLWTEPPMLYGVSRHLLPQPRDWPDSARVCGQWALPPPEWTPPPALQEFLAAGDAPIFVGFGSMAGFDRKTLLREVVAAVAGRRAVFQPGWSGVTSAELPGNFHVVGEAPHAWLFPRTSLVIHHGGSGTTHSAARAGVPSVVVPFAGDQFFWADRLMRAGVAGVPVNGKNVRAAALARGIAFAESADARSRAVALGAAMAQEDGPADAVAAIEALMAGRTR